MAVPKKKTCASRSKVRKSAWTAREQRRIVAETKIVKCPETGVAHLSHRVNPETGKYRGRQVLKTKTPAEKTRLQA